MTTLWNRSKPMTQPPHYGRIGMQPDHDKPCPITADAKRAVAEAQHARKAKTIKHGARATVR